MMDNIKIKIVFRIILILAAVLPVASVIAADSPFDAMSGSNMTPMPQPGVLLLLGSGLMGIALYRRLRNK